MKTKGEAFAGLSVAIVTPFKGDDVDYDTFRAQIEFQIAAGTNCLCPVGTTGESPTLSHEEQDRVIAFVVETVAGRVKVMPGTGSNSTAEALRLTKFAEKVGADAALQVAPYYNKPTQQGFYEHFQTARRGNRPAAMHLQYSRPNRQKHRAGNNHPPRRVGKHRAGEGSHRVARSGIANYHATNLTVLSGDDSLTLPLMAVGGRGVISVVGNIVPKDMIALTAAMDRGDLDEARSWHRKLFPLCRDMLGLATNPIPIKAAMKMLGRDPGDMRLPMTPLEDSGMSRLKKTLVDYGLL